jgi:hypothetical protein
MIFGGKMNDDSDPFFEGADEIIEHDDDDGDALFEEGS